MAAALQGITLVPPGVVGGASAKLRIFLTAPAPTGGAAVLISGFPNQPPATVTVPAGTSSLTPPLIPTPPVRSPQSYVVTASYAGLDRSALLTLRPFVADIVAFGGSGTSGQGLVSPLVEAWPARAQAHASVDGCNVNVINAGRSGRTSTAGLSEIDGVFTPATTVMVIALGANDVGAGIPTETTRANLAAMIDKCSAKRVSVLLVGHASVSAEIDAVMHELAATYGLPLVPDLNDGFTDADRQPDGHPTASGAIKQEANVYPALAPMLTL